MTDREKLIEVLTDLEKEDEFICDGCVRANKPIYIESLVNRLIAHGVTVREPQKPLTVEEVLSLPDVVYLECSYFDEAYAALPERYDKQTIDLMMRDECCRFLLKGYGKTWRCWAKKPTEEERKAAEWERPT